MKSGASSPKASAMRQKKTAALYWRCRSPELESRAFTGPVRQVETAPNRPVTMDAAPQPAVMALIGAAWPFAFSIAMPCAFCAASTVMASGTTSSTMAFHENCGT